MTETAEKPTVNTEAPEHATPPASVVHVDDMDALRMENMNLKVMGAGQAVEHAMLQAEMAARAVDEARRAYADNLRHQVALAQEISKRYRIEATRYDLDTAKKQLVLRGPRPAPNKE